MLTDYQGEAIERLQSQALKIIYGKDMKYRNMRDKAGVGTLRARRVEACDRFAAKCSKGRFSHWFPKKKAARATRSGAGAETYVEKFAQCGRLKNSPFCYMRRRLNGKPGKRYGERNRAYRD